MADDAERLKRITAINGIEHHRVANRIIDCLRELNRIRHGLQLSFAWWQRYIAVTFGCTSVLSIFLLYTAAFSDELPLFIALIFYTLAVTCFSHMSFATLAGNVLYNESCRVRLNVIKLFVALSHKRSSITRQTSPIRDVLKMLNHEVALGHYGLGCTAYGMYHMTSETYMQFFLSVASYFLLVASKF